MVERPLNILVWHVHSSWTTSFVQGGHRYLIPVLPEGGDWGRGRRDKPWPDGVVDVTPAEVALSNIDIVVLQRPEELELFEKWSGRQAGIDVPAVYVEHNTPVHNPCNMRHPMADRTDIPLVHVTHFNNLMWDSGSREPLVITHGVVDPGHLYSGELDHAATMINDPISGGRSVGTDLLAPLSKTVPIDVFGSGTKGMEKKLASGAHVSGRGNPDGDDRYAEVARRVVYLHAARWTSLGMNLLEAMHLGMPVVSLATTEAPSAIPPEAGLVSSDPEILARGMEQFIHEPSFASLCGKSARHFAVNNYGIKEFTENWSRLLTEVVR